MPIINGKISEFIDNAGIVDSIPATNIFSPSDLVVRNWKCFVENPHQAWTGNEKPNNQAGTPTKTAIINQIGLSDRNTGSIPKKATIIVTEKTNHKVEVFGNSRGGESLSKW